MRNRGLHLKAAGLNRARSAISSVVDVHLFPRLNGHSPRKVQLGRFNRVGQNKRADVSLAEALRVKNCVGFEGNLEQSVGHNASIF